MSEETITLSSFIYEKLNKQSLNLENPLKQAAVHYLLIKNIITIFGTEEFLSDEIETVIIENENQKYATLVIEHEGKKYQVKTTKDNSIILASDTTIPLFDINIKSDVIKNKLMYEREETILEEQEIYYILKRYYYQKTIFKEKGITKKAFLLQPTNFSHRGLEQFELIDEFGQEEESVYWLERLVKNIKKNNLREIPYGEDEVENLVEIFACLEEECENKEYKRKRTINFLKK